MQNKKYINILMISGIFILFIIFFFDVHCIFKTVFQIPCISCGLTRAFKCILKLDFITATKYNVLSIPLFIMITTFYITYFISIIFKKDYIYKLYNLLCKYYNVLIIFLIIGWLINLCKLNVLNYIKI